MLRAATAKQKDPVAWPDHGKIKTDSIVRRFELSIQCPDSAKRNIKCFVPSDWQQDADKLPYTGNWTREEEAVGLKRWFRIIAGILMLVVGVVFWALPFLPGWLLVIPGLMLLSHEFHWAKRLLNWLRSRLPGKSPQP